MKLSIFLVAAAALVGATEAFELIFYNGQGCRGARLTSESRGTGGCHAFDGAKSNTASVQVVRQSGDGNNMFALYGGSSCSAGTDAWIDQGCINRSTNQGRYNIVNSPF